MENEPTEDGADTTQKTNDEGEPNFGAKPRGRGGKLVADKLRARAEDQTQLHHFYGISSHAVSCVLKELADILDDCPRCVKFPPVVKRPHV